LFTKQTFLFKWVHPEAQPLSRCLQ